LGIARSLSRPLRRLIAAAEGLEQDRYTSEILNGELDRRDDLGRLATVFDRMAHQVQGRETRLRDQVRVLQIQIDEAKRASQVAEITETEYFRALRARARELRRGRVAPTLTP
jgi:nitrate/nitrite-specific signal transduction histidine kinase